jgi:hypothetical protein
MASEPPARLDRKNHGTPAEITADRCRALCACDGGRGRSKPEFCKNEPVAMRNHLKYIKLGFDGFRGKPAKLVENQQKPSPTRGNLRESRACQASRSRGFPPAK